MRESVLWSYDLRGNLIGLPFRKGVKQGEKTTAYSTW